jgi:peptidyl-prolyl cis-trans isomerase C
MKYLITITAFFLTFGCDNNSAPNNSLNDDVMSDELLEYHANLRAQTTLGELSDEERVALKQELSQLIKISNDAVTKGLDQNPLVVAEIAYSRLQVLANLAVSDYLLSNIPTEEVLITVFNENIGQFTSAEFKARHILVSTEEEALEIISLLDSGEDFDVLASDRSLDTGSAINGGDLGWFTPNTMVEPFANAVLAMEVGNYSLDPVQTQFGYHVILVEDSLTNAEASFEDYREEVNTIYQRELLTGYLEEMSQDTAM